MTKNPFKELTPQVVNSISHGYYNTSYSVACAVCSIPLNPEEVQLVWIKKVEVVHCEGCAKKRLKEEYLSR